MDTHSENQLLRMNKDELIEHIFLLYKENDAQFIKLGEFYNFIDEIIKLSPSYYEET